MSPDAQVNLTAALSSDRRIAFIFLPLELGLKRAGNVLHESSQAVLKLLKLVDQRCQRRSRKLSDFILRTKNGIAQIFSYDLIVLRAAVSGMRAVFATSSL